MVCFNVVCYAVRYVERYLVCYVPRYDETNKTTVADVKNVQQ